MRILPIKINKIDSPYTRKSILEQINKNMSVSCGKSKLDYNQSNNSFSKHYEDTFVFTGTQVHYSRDEVEEQKTKIKTVLQEFIKNNDTLKIKDISERTGIASHTVRRRVSEYEELQQLWKKARHIDYSKYSNEEKADFEEAIKELLENLNATGTKMSVQGMVDRIGVSKTIIFRIINKNEYYKELYENIHKTKPIKATAQEIEMQEKQIKEILLQVKVTGVKKSEREYSEILGITEKVFRLRIKNNPELKALYEEVKNPPRTKFENGIEGKKELIKIILKECIYKNKKLSRSEISTKAGISGGTFRRIILSDSEIKHLWSQVQQKPRTMYSQKEIERLDDYILWFLEDKIKKEQKTTAKEIADFFGISIGLTGKRLNENPKLKYRWNKVKSQNMVYFDKDEKEIQTEQITELLKEANSKNIKLTYEDISKLTKLSVSIIKSRIKNNRKAQKLWDENKKL